LKGWNKTQLAQAVGVSSAAIGQFEANVTPPRAELLPRLAKALDVEVEFLATGRPIGQLDTSQAHFRSLRSTRVGERSHAMALASQVWELSFALEKRVQFPEVRLISNAGFTPMAAARALRDEWRVSPGPVRHLVATMEAHGIVVALLQAEFLKRVDAFSTSAFERPIIVATPRQASNVFRHRFSCAHELGHLVLHGEVRPGDPQQEREADEFAAEFLTPESAIGPVLPSRVNLAELDRLSRGWGVSIESLLRRMTELRKISDASVRRAYQRLRSTTQLRTEEPVSAYRGENPALLREAQVVAEELGFSLADLAVELRWRPARVRELLGMEDVRPVLKLVR
jgi:Zn-dependent peptidase ImmA (M78 family)/DNA-binding XRE family transcriptional regulator